MQEVEEIVTAVNQLTSDTLLLQLDIRDVVEEAATDTRSAYPEATVDLEVPDDPVYVRGNELLRRAFVNLFNNGIEHNDSPDPAVRAAVIPSAGTVDIVVADTGPGLEGITTESDLHDLEPGTGLHIVVTIIQRFQGSISIDQTEEGTIFTVTLPQDG